MTKYYKVNIYSEDNDLSNYDKTIIVKKGFLYAKEIYTDTRIMICDNDKQGCFYDYYVLSSDFKSENIVKYDMIFEYMKNFELNKFPICSKLEEKQTRKLIKQYKKYR